MDVLGFPIQISSPSDPSGHPSPDPPRTTLEPSLGPPQALPGLSRTLPRFPRTIPIHVHSPNPPRLLLRLSPNHLPYPPCSLTPDPPLLPWIPRVRNLFTTWRSSSFFNQNIHVGEQLDLEAGFRTEHGPIHTSSTRAIARKGVLMAAAKQKPEFRIEHMAHHEGAGSMNF